MSRITEGRCQRLIGVAVVALWVLAGCGGGGGGGGGGGSATDSAGGGTQVPPGTGSDTGAGTDADTGTGPVTPGGGGTPTLPSVPVTPTPDGPLAIVATPSEQVMVGAVYSLQPRVSHATGKLNYSIDNKPAWADFEPETGRLVGVPLAKDLGTTSNIVIDVHDGKRSVALAAFEITVVPRPGVIEPPSTPTVEEPQPGRVMLTWEVPTLTGQDTALTDLEGYRVHHGVDAEAMVHAIELLGSGSNQVEIKDLAAGRHYFAVRAVRAGGEVSMLSNIVSRQVK